MRRAPALAVLGLLVSTRAGASHYTLDELVRKVETEAPNVLAARRAVESATSNLLAAQLLWLPTGEANLFLTGSPNVRCIGKPYDPNDPNTNVPDLSVPAEVRESNCLRTNVVDLVHSTASLADRAPIHGVLLRLDVNLTQPLLSFGRIEAAIAAARAGIDSARANLERERADAAVYAQRTYWGFKAAGAAVSAIGEVVEKLRAWVARVDAQLNGNNPSHYTESDLARLKIALAYANTQLFDQQRNLAYAKDALRLMTGDPQAEADDGELELVDDDQRLSTWQARAEVTRPEMRSLKANDAAAHASRLARLADLLPELALASSLGAGYASSMDSPLNYYLNRPTFLDARFGLQLRQPLDLGVRAARFLQAKHDEQATRARSDASRMTYAAEIAKAYEDYQEARARAKETARGEKISRGWYLAVDNNIASGLTQEARELVEAAQNYFSFRLRNFQAIYDANVALAWLRRTTVGAAN